MSANKETELDKDIGGKEMNRDEKFKLGEKCAMIGVVGNIILTILKAFAGVIAGSSAMIADAIHSASDIFSSIVVFFSLKIAKKPADENHPYGHGKVEAISTLVVSVLLISAGVHIFRSSYETIREGTASAPGALAVYAAILSIVIKEWMYRYTLKVGKKINSPSTVANAWEHRSDAISSVAALIGIVGAKLGFPILDPIAGAVVSLFIIRMGFEIISDAIHQIMDKSLDEEVIEIIEKEAMKVKGVKCVCRVRGRQSGPYTIGDVIINVDKDITLDEAHDISLEVRDAIMANINDALDILVHVGPYTEESKEHKMA